MANTNDSSTTASGWTCPRCYTWVPGGEPHVRHQSLAQSWAVYPPNYEAVLNRIADAIEEIAKSLKVESSIVQEKYPLNPDGSIPGIPKPDAALDAFCVPLCKHDGLLYGLVADGKVVEPCPICGKSGMEEGWRPPW